jgi:hypothetical protein
MLHVVSGLLKVNRVPILLYGLEAYDSTRAPMSSIDFAIVRADVKIFRCTNKNSGRLFKLLWSIVAL